MTSILEVDVNYVEMLFWSEIFLSTLRSRYYVCEKGDDFDAKIFTRNGLLIWPRLSV